MNISFKNYFKPRSKKTKKIILALKVLIGTIATASFVQKYETLAFILLVSGALIDFLSELIKDEEDTNFDDGIV